MKNLKQFLFLLLTLFFSTKNYSQCQTTLLTLPNQVTESFEGIPVSANNPTYFNGYTIPITGFSFPSGLILSFPSPNTSGGALLCDFAKASATWGLCSSSIASPANVPTGNAFLGLNSSTGNALFTLPYVTSDIGLLVESCVGVITLTTYDSSNNIINSCTRNGTGNVANWASSYLGFHSSSSNIKSFRIQGNFVALDNIKWSGPTIITCPGNITTTTTGQCGKNVSFIATATGTPTPSITYSPASGSFFNIGTTTVTATATNSGGSASCTFTVTVNDTQPPSLAVVPPVPHVYDDYGRKSTFTNINLGGTGINVARVAPSTSVSLTFNRSTILTGACPGCITQHYVGIAGVWASQCLFSTTGASSGSHSFTFTAPSTPGVYYITRRGSWEFSCISVPMPSSRNEALAVLIVGNSSACPDNVVVNADPGQCGAVVSSANPTIIDNCPGGTVVQTAGLPSGSLYPVGTTTNTFLATDASGNTATCSYTVTVNDTQPPVITCPSNITVSNTVGQCSANVSFAATATDNCGTATLSYSPASGSTFSVGTTTVTATANDGHGNTASCTFTVTVNDTQAPVVTCPANIVISNTPDQCGAKVCYTTPVVVENCIPATPAGYTYKTNYGTSYYYQSNVLMNYTTAQSSATAAGGHLAVITSAAENSALSSSGAGFGWLGGNDLAANGSWVLATCEPFSYTNWCGGEPNGGTFENHLEFESGGCWNDLVETALRYSIIEIEGAKLTQTAGLAQNAFFPVGTTTNTFLATDASGNTATCSFTVTVNDTQPPVITCPSNITVSNTVGQCGANVSFAATATDNCGTATLSYSPASGSLFTIGTTTVTATADDGHGNTASCTFTVTVNDTQPPVITCPANIVVSNDTGVCGANVNYAITASDNCSSNTNSNYIQASKPYAPIDMTGNTFLLNGDDFIQGPFALPFNFNYYGTNFSSLYASTNGFLSFTLPNVGQGCCQGQALPNCNFQNSVALGWTDWITTVIMKVSGSAPNRIVTLQWNGSEYGNSGTVLGQISLYETTNEIRLTTTNINTVIPFHVITQGLSKDCTIANPVAGRNAQNWAATNECISFSPETSVQLVSGIASGGLFPVGTTTNTFVATDASGNSTTCSFTVTVNDTEAPVITCPANIVVDMDPGQCGAVVTFAGANEATATDNCGATITYSPASGSFFAVGTTTVTATADDGHGNTASCTFTVTVDLLNWVNLQWPPSQTICQGSSMTAYGQVYEPGVSTLGYGIQGPNIEAQFGYNPSNTNPSTWSSWSPATFNALANWPNNNEYFYDFTPPTSGTFYYTFRYRQNGCGDWQYGGYNVSGGGFWDGTTNLSGTVTVDPTTVGGAVSGGTSPICKGFAPGTLTLSGHTGAVLQWESSTDNLNWYPIANTTNSHSPGVLLVTTQFRAVVQSGVCLIAYSTPRAITVYQEYPFYADNDHDGYGAGPSVYLCSVNATTVPAGYSLDNTDCDDTKGDRHQTYPFYVDADGDTYGATGSTAVQLCAANATTPPLPHYSVNALDCNDAVASIHPGVVDIPYDSIDNNCDGSLFDGHAPLVVAINDNSCGGINHGLNNSINCNEIYLGPGYVIGYRFKVTNLATGEVAYVDTVQHHFKLTDTNIYSYGTAYSIQVAAIVNGEVQPFNGPICTLTTASVATTKVVPAQCGSTLVLMNSTISATAVNAALAYRFRVSRADAPGIFYYSPERTLPNFNLTMLTVPVGFLTYATEYRVDVQIKIKLANFIAWSQLGQICSIFTPVFPASSVIASQCTYFDTHATSSSTVVNANPFPGATMYRFLLTGYDNLGNINYQQYIDRTVPNFTLSMFTGLTPNTTYTIAVSMQLYGVYVPYGKDCSITTTAPLRETSIKEDVAPFKATAYPNPFANNFVIDVKSTSTSIVNLKVYDMVGRLVEQRSVSVTELENSPIGERYPSGVYNVVVAQDDEVKTVRVVKR